MPYIQFAQPIEKLIPACKDSFERQHYLEIEIARLTPIVGLILNQFGLSVMFNRTIRDSQGDPKQESFDILNQYLHVPLGSPDGQHLIDPLMTLLEKGIGVGMSRQERARYEFLYPTTWLAYLIRLPITVLVRAGILPSSELIGSIYGKFIQILTLVLIVLLSIKLGIAIPWERIIGYILK